jgi:hypothetical protein
MEVGRMLDSFVISPLDGNKFINTKCFGNKKLIVNISIENAKDVNRFAIVKSIPLNYKGNVKKGDTILVQHNVFRDYYDASGQIRTSDWHIKDDLYYVQPELAYLIIRGEEKIAIDDFCFVKPIFTEDRFLGKVEAQHQGFIKFGNESLKEQGVFEGDHIGFHNGCEVPFVIDDELLYKMKTKRILAKLN